MSTLINEEYDNPQVVVDFIQTVGLHNGSSGQPIFCAQINPVTKGDRWPPMTMGPFLSKFERTMDSTASYYISTMLSTGTKNRQSQFGGLAFIILDDVGTKALPLDKVPLKPSWVVESSKDNYQCGYLFDEPLMDLDLAKRILKKLGQLGREAEAGSKLTDEGGVLVNKFVRLPWGTRNKQFDGMLDDYPCRLVKWNDIRYTIKEISAAFGITGVSNDASRTGDDEEADITLNALYSEDMVHSKKEDGYLIVCPWGSSHSDRAEDHGMYYPVGSKMYPKKRGYKCHHSSCFERTGDHVAGEMRALGHTIPMSSELEYFQQRYVMIRHGKQVGDLKAAVQDGYQPTLDFSEFQYENHQMVNVAPPNVDAVWTPLHSAWLKSRYTTRTKGTLYNPEDRTKVVTVKNETYFNLYSERDHVPSDDECLDYIKHVAHILPEYFDSELFHDWIGFKLQNPDMRSYMFLMIATRDHHASKFGIGRSVLGDILSRVFQTGVETVSFNKFTGRDKDIFNGWCEGSQLIVIPEIKDDSTNRKEAIHAYEKIKEYVDVAPSTMSIRHMRQTSKTARVYYNVLGFSNHADAISIPKDDRRIYVAKNTDTLRTDEEYTTVHDILNSTQEIANIYWWYMARDVSAFEHYRPPIGKAKERMFELTMSEGETIITAILEDLPGDIVTKSHLMVTAIEMLNEEGLDEGSYEGKFVMKDIHNFWKKLPSMAPDNPKGARMRVGGTLKPVRCLRNEQKWSGTIRSGQGGNKMTQKEVNKNQDYIANLVKQNTKYS